MKAQIVFILGNLEGREAQEEQYGAPTTVQWEFSKRDYLYPWNRRAFVHGNG